MRPKPAALGWEHCPFINPSLRYCRILIRLENALASAELSHCPPGFEGMKLDLTRSAPDAWVVEARAGEGSDPPLRVIFRGPRAYEQALEFYLSFRPVEEPPNSAGLSEPQKQPQMEVAQS